MKTKFTIGATSQSVAEVHNIALFGNPCPIKYDANIAIKSTFNAMAANLRSLIATPHGF